jgi:hypothetical protein
MQDFVKSGKRTPFSFVKSLQEKRSFPGFRFRAIEEQKKLDGFFSGSYL